MDQKQIDHAAIFARIETAETNITNAEGRITRLLFWLATGFCGLAFAAITWGAGERTKQLDTNAEVANQAGATQARQDEITRRLDDISELIRTESQLTREIITRHAADRHAHESPRGE